MTRQTSELGSRGEDAAAAYAERIGMTVIERNWRSGRGEIDIIALDGDALVFIEVKTRRSRRAGTPEEAVSQAKQLRLSRLASTYLTTSGIEPRTVRFDVIAIDVLAEDRALLRHHRSAFTIEV